MAFQTTVFLSVLAVALSIIAHQSDPEIIPSLLEQSVDALYTVNKNVNYYYNEYFSDTAKWLGLDTLWPNRDFSRKDVKEEGNAKYVNNKNKPKKGSNSKEVLLSKDEIKEYDGKENSKGVYVAILGSVFDVESGKKHYGPGGGYHFFAGKDGSRAFITGEFNDAGLIDDVSGLTPKDLKALQEWVKFYHKDYKYVGKLVGRFYDSNGKRTLEMKELMKSVKNFEREEEKSKEENKIYPPCNVEWNKEHGSRVWCTTKSGGVVRPWAGVPRQLFEGSGKKSRCTCVEPQLAVSDPRLAEYEGCPPGSDSCWVREL